MFQLPHDLKDLFHSYTILSKERDPQTSHELLSRAASEAAKVMRKRGFKVLKLVEFKPKNDSLHGLNVNRGQKVCVRVRSNAGHFLPYEHVLGTLLHELVHIEISAHSASFYDQLELFWKEVESGHSSFAPAVPAHVPFAGQGHVLGGKRNGGKSSLLNSLEGGFKLGGSLTLSSLPPRQAAAQATLARLQLRELQESDHEACGTQIDPEDIPDDQEQQQGPSSGLKMLQASHMASTKLANSKDEVITLLSDEEECQSYSPQSKRLREVETKQPPEGKDRPASTWMCSHCTFANETEDFSCSMCQEVRTGFWKCKSCTFVNIDDHLQCKACHEVKVASN